MADDIAPLSHEDMKAARDWRVILEDVGPAIESEGRACDRENRFVGQTLDRLHKLGFFGLGAPEAFGGGGAEVRELGAMLRALGRRDGSTALTLAMHTHQVAAAEWRRTHAGAPTEGLLRKVAEGTRLVSSGGSDWIGGSGRAVKVEGGYKVSGRKVFASGSPDGNLFMTSAIYDDPGEGPTVLHFGVPMNAGELTVIDTWDALGMRGTGSHDIELAGVFVAEAAIGGRRPAGKWHQSFHIVTLFALPLIYSVYAGIADAMRDTVLELTRTRTLDPSLVAAVGEMQNAHRAMNLALEKMLELAAGAEPGPRTTDDIAALRGVAVRSALEVASRAMECAGGVAFYRRTGLEQRFRDMQAARYHPLQDRQQQLMAGRTALSLDIDG